jgi:hypothetical protein
MYIDGPEGSAALVMHISRSFFFAIALSALSPAAAVATAPACANATGLTLPAGFCATVFADNFAGN